MSLLDLLLFLKLPQFVLLLSLLGFMQRLILVHYLTTLGLILQSFQVDVQLNFFLIGIMALIHGYIIMILR